MAQYLDKAGLTTLWTKIKNTFALKKHTHKKSEITDLTIPTVNNPTITINQGGVKKGSFSLNQSGAATIDLTDDNTTYSAATQSANGLMSTDDKKKLDGIETGANKITVDSALSSTSTNPVQNKVIKSALDGKAGSSHSHSSLTNSSGRIFNVPTGGSGGEQKTLVITDDLNAYQPAGNYANASHDHTISDITGLYDELTGMTYVTDSSDNSVQLETYGDGNSFSIPTKGYVDSALNGKSNLDHNHDSVYQAKGDYATNDALKSYVTGTTFIDYTTYIEGEVNKKANASHDHDISDINGLQSALDGKSNTGHGHAISDITNLQSTIESIYSDMGLQDEAIAGKADVGHTHKKSDITDLSIPTVNNPTITINQGGTKKGSFTLNQSGATTIDLTDNNTTYTAGAGLDLSNGIFSVKTGYTTNGKNYKVTTDNSGNLYVSVPWNNDTWRPVVDNLTTTDATKSLSANQGKVLKDLVDGKLTNYNNTVSRPNGTSFTFPNGTNPVQMRSGATSGADLGIFRLSDDNAFICNSSDIGYAFAVFDTDKTSDFSSASNAAFAVLSDHSGVSIKGGLSVDGKAVSLDGHTHSYLPLSGGTINAGGSKAPLILKGGASNWNEGLRIVPAGNWSTIMLGGNDITETEGTSANSWSIHNNDGKFYISKNGSDYASTKLSNTDGTWRVNDNTIIHSGNIGSQNVNYANSAGSANSVAWGNVSGRPSSLPASNISMSSDGTTLTITYS